MEDDLVGVAGLKGKWLFSRSAARWAPVWPSVKLLLEAERHFRRIIGYRDLASLAVVIGRDLARTTAPSPTEEAAIFVTV